MAGVTSLQRPDAVDLFAGPGGWDVAAERLGVKTLGIEYDPAACETRRAAGLPTIEGDVRDYSPADWPTARGLIASPPCQTFSAAGKGAGRDALDLVLEQIEAVAEGDDIDYNAFDDERTGLVLEPLRWARDGEYEWLAFEQVPTVLPVWEAMADVLRAWGWSVAVSILNSADYGVPQQRKRAILIATRGSEAALPMPTTHTPRTIEDVLPERAGWEQHGLRGAGLTARHGARPGRRSNQPSFTIMAWKDSRLVWRRDGEREAPTTRELALLQTFPEDYPFQGAATTQHKQIGNAIPPALAESVLTAAVAASRQDAMEVAA